MKTVASGPQVVHVYDGIEEHDNRLPNWWLGLLFSSIVFALAYWLVYEVTHSAPDALGEYAQEVAEAARRDAAMKPISDETLLGLAKDPQTVGAGMAVFKGQCASCHGAQAQGLIGPNLTDAYWLHGDRPVEIHHTIAQGAVAKGMPSWEKVLGPERVRQVAAYVLTLKGSNVPGKAPQGEKAP